MKVTSSAITNGVIDDKYGKRGGDIVNGVCVYSIPFEITDAPANTVCFAAVLDDKDAVPVCGFTWIHWLVANLKKTSVGENESARASFKQGRTSSHGALGKLSLEQASKYEGMAPPDRTHRYDLTVYALDCELTLENGFGYNDLWYAMDGHILAQSTVTGKYDA